MLKRTICVACKGALMANVLMLEPVDHVGMEGVSCVATVQVERQYVANAIPDNNVGIKAIWCPKCGLCYSVDALKVETSND